MPYVSPADRDGPVQSARTRFKVTEVILHVKPSNELAIELYTSLKFYTTETKPRFCKSVPNDAHKNYGLYYIDSGGDDALAITLLLGVSS